MANNALQISFEVGQWMLEFITSLYSLPLLQWNITTSRQPLLSDRSIRITVVLRHRNSWRCRSMLDLFYMITTPVAKYTTLVAMQDFLVARRVFSVKLLLGACLRSHLIDLCDLRGSRIFSEILILWLINLTRLISIETTSWWLLKLTTLPGISMETDC